VETAFTSVKVVCLPMLQSYAMRMVWPFAFVTRVGKPSSVPLAPAEQLSAQTAQQQAVAADQKANSLNHQGTGTLGNVEQKPQAK